MTDGRWQQAFWLSVENAIARHSDKRYPGRPVGRSHVSPFSIRHPVLGALKMSAQVTVIVGGLFVVGLVLQGRRLGDGTLFLVSPLPAMSFIVTFSYYHFLHRHGATTDGTQQL